MKIGIFSNRFHPTFGGVQASTRLMAQQLVKLGHTVTVVTRSPGAGEPELEEGYAVLRTRSMIEVARLAARCDVMILRGGVSKFAAVPSMLVGAMVIVFHEMAWQTGNHPSWLRRIVLRRAVLHVGVSHSSLATIRLSPDVPATVLYNPVSDELRSREVPSFDARPTDILFVGRMIDAKGVWILADALERLAKPVRVAFVGDGAERYALEERVARLPSVEASFHGVQSGAALRRFYAEARVVVVPSQVYEGMGMVVAEAMANGTPVVVSDQAPLRETMGGGGMAFEMHSPSKLADALEILLNDPAEWQARHRSAELEAERFSLETYRRALCDLLSYRIYDGHSIQPGQSADPRAGRS